MKGIKRCKLFEFEVKENKNTSVPRFKVKVLNKVPSIQPRKENIHTEVFIQWLSPLYDYRVRVTKFYQWG